ncbi:YlzJ-like family protein [Calderihabitans maritimus]|uniref:YlzJ-like protein n=1 Tax=Calderihabitans maritimus TaxID=1246530 RepID=A0A1Z5HRG8_9FIRM|nr:YlzJ-like family protein [Calderihabitans maritimus]GAW92116.1 hypothetical protein Toce_1224 [Calderihabitans maritimus]
MLLYTPLPLEQVLEGYDKERRFQEIECQGAKILVEPIDLTRGRILRIFATDPRMYLNPQYEPGSMVEFVPYPEEAGI